MRLHLFAAALVLAAAAAPAPAAPGDPPAPPNKEADGMQLFPAAEIKWQDGPPSLPKGAQIAVLYGDPFKSGPFTLRLKMPSGYKIPPHWHTQDEQLTILSGTFLLHMGDTMDAAAHDLEAGAYHFLPGKMHHAAETRGETILQLHGTGPFDIHYLNPADNPAKAAPAKGATAAK